MNKLRSYIDNDITDVMIDRPFTFRVGKKRFNLYHARFGHLCLLKRLYRDLNIEDSLFQTNPYNAILKLIKDKKDIILRYIVYLTVIDPKDIFSEPFIESRINFFKANLDDEEIVSLFIFAFSFDNLEEYQNHLGITEQIKTAELLSNIKESKYETIIIGGASQYGSLIGKVCEKYGWTYQYSVWGISYINLILLLNDAVSTVMLSPDEQKKVPRNLLRKPNRNGDVVDINSPEALEQIRKLRAEMRNGKG